MPGSGVVSENKGHHTHEHSMSRQVLDTPRLLLQRRHSREPAADSHRRSSPPAQLLAHGGSGSPPTGHPALPAPSEDGPLCIGLTGLHSSRLSAEPLGRELESSRTACADSRVSQLPIMPARPRQAFHSKLDKGDPKAVDQRLKPEDTPRDRMDGPHMASREGLPVKIKTGSTISSTHGIDPHGGIDLQLFRCSIKAVSSAM